MSCNFYVHQDNIGGSKYISGTTCSGTQASYYLNYGESVCMDNDKALVNLNGLIISGACLPITPTPSTTPYEYCFVSGLTYTTVPFQCPNDGLIYYDVYGTLRLTSTIFGAIQDTSSGITVNISNGIENQTVVIPNGQTFTEFVYPKVNFRYTNTACLSTSYPDWYVIGSPTNTQCLLTTPTPTTTPTQTPTNTSTNTQTPTNTSTNTPSVTPTSTSFGDCNRLYVDFNIGSGYVDEYFSFSSTLSPGFINLIPLSGFSLTCSTYNSQSYAVYTGETTGKALIYNSQNNQFVIWDNLTSPQCGSLTGSIIISASWSTGFTDNGFIHPLNGGSNNLLANLNYDEPCNAAPTPTVTRTPTHTPTQTMTQSPTPGYCCDQLYFSGKTASYSAFTGTYSIQPMNGNYIGYIDDLGGYTSKCITQNGIKYTIWKNTNDQLIAFSEGNGKFILLPNSFVTFTTCNTYFASLAGSVELTSGYTEDCFSLALPITDDTSDYSLSYVNCHLAPTPTPSVTASQTATQTVTPTSTL